MKHLSTSLKIAVQLKESSDTEAAEELTKWLENIWRERVTSAGISDLHLETTEEERTTTPSPGTHALPGDEDFPGQVEQSEPNEEHLLMDLPQQISKRVLRPVLLAKKSSALALRPQWQTNAASPGSRPHGECSVGFVLEAWGNPQSLQLLRELISDEAKTKPLRDLVTDLQTRTKPPSFAIGMINEYRFTVFKNCSSASSPIQFVYYPGPCQAQHDGFTCQRPCVRHPNPESSFSRDKFVKQSLKQLDRINTNYDKSVYGGIDAVMSFGTFYVAKCSTQEVPESEFDGLLGVNLRNATSSHQFRQPGWAVGRDRTPIGSGPGRSFTPQPEKYLSSSFIPTGNPNIDRSRLQEFLQNRGFVFCKEDVEYRLTLEPSTAEKQMRKDTMLALDENFEPTYAHVLENHWLCVNVVSANKDSSFRPYDCRFVICSCMVVTDRQSQTSDNSADASA